MFLTNAPNARCSMAGPEYWFSRWVVRHRRLIVCATLMMVGAISFGVRNLSFTTDYRVFFGPDNPERMAFESLENTYSKRDNIMIIVAPKQGSVFSAEILTLVADLTERAWQIPYSNRVDSISNFQLTRANGDDLIVHKLVIF